MKCNKKLLIILIIAGLFRIFHCLDLPLTGEEAGVAMLQACGHAHEYRDKLPEGIVSADQIKSLIRYCPKHSSKDVIDSMRFAGMHPPAYYLMLHYMLKFIPYSNYLIRSVSFIASILSIIYLYLLGKNLYNETTGLIAAFILACSGYGIYIGTLARPYSVIMFISLITTYQALQISAQGGISFRNPKIYLYLLLCVLGLYTLYHFIFVFLFQMILLFLHNARNKRIILTLITCGIMVIICFLPSIGFLHDQMEVISSGQYYFHEKPDFIRFIGNLSSINSIRFFHLESIKAKAIVAMAFLCLMSITSIAGIPRLVNTKNRRVILIAFLAHLVIYFAIEKITNISSLHKIKMLFFILPVFLIFLSDSFQHLTRRFHLKVIVSVLFAIILVSNSIAATVVKPKLTGPYRYLEMIPPKIDNYLGHDKNGLVIFNTQARKPLFAFSNTLDDKMDILIIQPPLTREKLNILTNIKTVKNYDALFMTDFYVPYEKNYITDSDREMIVNHFQSLGFSYSKTWDSKYIPKTRAVMLFKKNSN